MNCDLRRIQKCAVEICSYILDSKTTDVGAEIKILIRESDIDDSAVINGVLGGEVNCVICHLS